MHLLLKRRGKKSFARSFHIDTDKLSWEVPWPSPYQPGKMTTHREGRTERDTEQWKLHRRALPGAPATGMSFISELIPFLIAEANFG